MRFAYILIFVKYNTDDERDRIQRKQKLINDVAIILQRNDFV